MRRPVLLQADDLDRRIAFERPVTGEGFDDAGSGIWAPVCTVWAQVRDVLPSRAERLADGLTIVNRPARIRIRYREDITSDMRILYGTRVMQIVAGPVELGRREGLEMMAEEYRPAGNPA
ncbi:phage head-tail adaptor protein [Sphingomonas oleivorans]|uniref:Phage head-tail adaptor protein n=1 Tax=Sphingomonas oleivorans TaxID=1735121 RepID=A0A2T5G1D3_9SPHN|nr:phage head closure protein [Sphingomonas oleivorans]PTQ12955.1 phage head-tail adaptor protein [Sphingomonas oleivorans]